ncbi:hypothetical protein Z962_07850 [Clostridium botulinum C/D str. BKT12695]|nr:hypothetical protein Z962_07850 [Clostridium botulinum C/D str. BKT12695]
MDNLEKYYGINLKTLERLANAGAIEKGTAEELEEKFNKQEKLFYSINVTNKDVMDNLRKQIKKL